MTDDESLQQAIHEPIELRPYDPAWPSLFAAERRRLADVAPDLTSVEHVGSTAVPGLSAKPVIDLLAAVPDLGVADALVVRLCGQGYVTSDAFNRTLGDRRWLMRHADGRRTHHLHLVLAGSGHWHDMIAFRDALRRDPHARAAYERLKFEWAADHAADRDAYTASKAQFVAGLLAGSRHAGPHAGVAAGPSLPERVAATERGENPKLVCRMRSGHLVLCDRQTPRGWCILVAVPVVHDLDDLDADRRAAFLADMAAAGAALKRVTGAYRVNYSILGNTDPYLHAHLHPRFADEPDDVRRQPLWAVWHRLEDRPFDAAREASLLHDLRRALTAVAVD